MLDDMNPSKRKHFSTVMSNILAWIKEKFGNHDYVRDLEKAWGEAFAESQSKKGETDGEVKYSLSDENSNTANKTLLQQLKDWLKGKGKKYGTYNGKYFELGTTPNVFLKHGAKNSPLIMFNDCVAKITGLKGDEAHIVSTEEIAELPNQLKDPILLFKGSVENSFVALTELKDKHGNDVIVAVHINKYLGRTEINKIASLYSKTDSYGNNKIVQYVNKQTKTEICWMQV